MARAGSRIRYAIICDDVRREDNGKFILIGVYGSSILLPHFPASLTLCALIALDVLEPGEFSFEMRIKFGRRLLLHGQAEVEVDKPGLSLLPARRLQLRDLPSPGELILQAKRNQERWVTALSIPIDLKPD